MSFVSLEFLIFFALTITLYFIIPKRFHILLLLVASYLFYAYWNTSYIILLLVSTLTDYIAARLIPHASPQRKRIILASTLAVNLGILFIFKYFNFFSASIGTLLMSLGLGEWQFSLQVLLPVGISFYTFQSMAYTIDVYRGGIEPEHDFGRFALYVAFFPQLVAGPIERAANILPQFRRTQRFEYHRVIMGMRMVLWGLFKKTVIGDRVAAFVNIVYAQPDAYGAWSLWLATLFFAFQIYCDFSGYSDIASGTAKIMGFNLMQNFRQPYFARSLSAFWRRWHISLSTWFQDYVYIPLGGNRAGVSRHLFNLFIVFLLSGLWHGAAWTFVCWGALHGIFVAVEAFWRQRRGAVKQNNSKGVFALAQWAATFILVLITWVFFRSPDINTAFTIIGSILSPAALMNLGDLFTLISQPEIIVSLLLIGFLNLADWLDAQTGLLGFIDRQPLVLRWAAYYILVTAVFVSVTSGQVVQEFIYFQF